MSTTFLRGVGLGAGLCMFLFVALLGAAIASQSHDRAFARRTHKRLGFGAVILLGLEVIGGNALSPYAPLLVAKAPRVVAIAQRAPLMILFAAVAYLAMFVARERKKAVEAAA